MGVSRRDTYRYYLLYSALFLKNDANFDRNTEHFCNLLYISNFPESNHINENLVDSIPIFSFIGTLLVPVTPMVLYPGHGPITNNVFIP